MKIQFDEINLLADMVGSAHGVSGSEVKASSAMASEGLQAFRQRSESGEIGFPHLPFQSAAIAAIRKYAAGVRGSYETVCLLGIGGSALGSWAHFSRPLLVPSAILEARRLRRFPAWRTSQLG